MTPLATPLTFDTDAGWCAGWYHAPAAPWRDLAVVLCAPFGHEASCSHPTRVQLARALAQAGLPVLTFDWHGTGDSDGDETLPDRLAAWRASVDAAIAQARAASGARHVALVGWRLGATLALDAATRRGDIDSLLLWAPCPTGKAFLRELRAAGTSGEDGSLHALGHPWAAATQQELQGLDAARFAAAPAARAWVVPRDDLPVDGPLPRALAAAGVDVQVQVLPGYAAMVDEPRAGVLDAPTLQAVAGWLCASPAAQPRTEAPLQPAAPARERCTASVCETVQHLRPDGTLVGVWSEPLGGARAASGVVLLNVGGNPHTGPHRCYVGMARALAAAGHRVLRLDLPGIGDSLPLPGTEPGTLYDKAAAADVGTAIEQLRQAGCRDIVLMGICSGSYMAFQTALADARVDGIVVMNARLLDWTPGQPGDTWQTSMQQYAKSTDWYRRAALRSESWKRLLRGEVHVRLIAQRFASLGLARLRRLLVPGAEGRQSLRGRMQGLLQRGCDVLMLVSDADDGRDYVEFHFGADGRRLRGHPGFRMAYVQDADHTFSRPGNQAQVLPLLLQFMAARSRRRTTDAAEPEPAAATLLRPDGAALEPLLSSRARVPE